eukprot:1727599-Rhodomonas_salina.1
MDKYELARADQFVSRMEQGLRGADVILICLSLPYLASRNCLLELQWAIEEYCTKGKPLWVVSVDPNVTYSKINTWNREDGVEGTDSKGNAIRVEPATVRVVQNWLGKVNIFTEWLEEGPEARVKQSKAVSKMLDNVSNNRTPVQAPPLPSRLSSLPSSTPLFVQRARARPQAGTLEVEEGKTLVPMRYSLARVPDPGVAKRRKSGIGA